MKEKPNWQIYSNWNREVRIIIFNNLNKNEVVNLFNELNTYKKDGYYFVFYSQDEYKERWGELS